MSKSEFRPIIAQMGWGRIGWAGKEGRVPLVRVPGRTLFSRRFLAKEPGLDRKRVCPGTGTRGPRPSSFPRALRTGARPGPGMPPFQGIGTSSRMLPWLCPDQQGRGWPDRCRNTRPPGKSRPANRPERPDPAVKTMPGSGQTGLVSSRVLTAQRRFAPLTRQVQSGALAWQGFQGWVCPGWAGAIGACQHLFAVLVGLWQRSMNARNGVDVKRLG